MIVVMHRDATQEDIRRVEEYLTGMGFKTHPIYGQVKTVIGAVGDKSCLNKDLLSNLTGVEAIVSIMKPYKLVSREFKSEDTTVAVDDVVIGGRDLVIMAGPCAVENRHQLLEVAQRVKEAGAKILRGGAYKPRTSPYDFQGLELEGLKLLEEAKQATGLKVVTEVMDTRDVELISRYADILQIGARNMQNFRLLKEVGQGDKPVILKRGLAATIEEWLMAAEYIVSEGNGDVILCERGIRTYETAARNTMDINTIPIVKQYTHLPIIADPSHGTGNWKLVGPVSQGLIAAGADGLLIEVHPDPACALCDGAQSLQPHKFQQLMDELVPIARAVDRGLK
ncbi:MAG TPA: 3-deoxy-7-phosphoheptulonate synthase [Clostridiales bacterium]|nr:3-deoxy-7-phosphoheptulonate synthase [Clostridiales bacterium]